MRKRKENEKPLLRKERRKGYLWRVWPAASPSIVKPKSTYRLPLRCRLFLRLRQPPSATGVTKSKIAVPNVPLALFLLPRLPLRVPFDLASDSKKEEDPGKKLQRWTRKWKLKPRGRRGDPEARANRKTRASTTALNPPA